MRHLAKNLATHAKANICNPVTGGYHNKVDAFFSYIAHTLIIMQIVLA